MAPDPPVLDWKVLHRATLEATVEGEVPLMPDSLHNARVFMAAVRRLTAYDGDGPPPMSLPLQGARAMARVVLGHPVVAGERRPDQVLQLFGEPDRRGREALAGRGDLPGAPGPMGADGPFDGLRDDALGFVVGGTLALGMVGEWHDDLADPLLTAALDLSPESLVLRTDLLDKPFGPPEVLPEWMERLDRLVDSLCWVGVMKAVLELGKYAGGASTSDAAGITSVSTGWVCPGGTIEIQGSGFTSGQPTGTTVYVPTGDGTCREAKVLSWSDKRITIEAPPGTRPGCVGFVRAGTGGFIGPNEVSGALTQCVGAVGQIWARGFDKIVGPIVTCPPCLPGGQNRLDLAGRPVVHTFSVTPASVEPGVQAVLSWNVEAAQTVTITRSSMSGPVPALPNPLPAQGSVTLPPFTGTTPTQATYLLTADNPCARVFADATLELTRRPRLKVAALEVVQSIQKTDNSVRLTARRRTAVRVYVDSGITDGFDLGDGPGMVSGLRASVLAENLDTGTVMTCGGPWDAGFLAGPAVDREMLNTSAVFDVPLAACEGRVRFRAVVEAPSTIPGAPPVSWAEGSVEVSFTAKQPQELLPLLVTDPLTTGTPATITDFFANLAGPHELQPFPEVGFVVNPPISVTLSPTDSLTVWSGWERFILRWATTFFLFPSQPVGGIRTGVVTNDAAYPWAGMAWPRIGALSPVMISVAGDPGTCAHELGHTYGLMHGNCGGPAGPYDGRLPLMTSDPGVNVVQRTLTPTGANELMTYCYPQWPTVEHWDAMFDRIPI